MRIRRQALSKGGRLRVRGWVQGHETRHLVSAMGARISETAALSAA